MQTKHGRAARAAELQESDGYGQSCLLHPPAGSGGRWATELTPHRAAFTKISPLWVRLQLSLALSFI